MPQKKLKSDAVVVALREFGLAYPGAHTKSPWPGHADLAVRDKTFAYLTTPGEPLSISCKLPESGHAALALPFAAPTAWGLGKSGWVTATFKENQSPPIELLKSWIDESYRAQAPKKLVAQMDAHAGTSAAKAGAKARGAQARKSEAGIAKAAKATKAAKAAKTATKTRKAAKAKAVKAKAVKAKAAKASKSKKTARGYARTRTARA
jgi:predicted DNA-binding protein (MmcQ/YjbR family)